MSAIHSRSELVEPLLLAHGLREADAFHTSLSTRSRVDILRSLARAHVLDDAAIAEGLELIDQRNAGDLERKDPFHRAIRDDAERWLVLDGDHWILRVDPRKVGHEIVRWRGVTMLIPPSIVIAGALANHRISYPRWIQTLPGSVAPQDPVGHLHVHLGPMLPFEALWGHLWTTLLIHGSLDPRGGRKGIDTIARPALTGIAPRGGWKQPGLGWQWLLELALLGRAWLERRLECFADDDADWRVLRCFAAGEVDVTDRRRTLLALWASDSFGRWARRKAKGVFGDRERHLRAEFRGRERAIQQGKERFRTDPPPERDHKIGFIAEAKGRAQIDSLPESDDEVGFMARALARCEREHTPKKTEVFARVFYQYLRVKVALYGRLVVDPWTTGLRHFLDVVSRDKPYADVVGEKDALSSARLVAARCEPPLNVAALEVHTVPGSWLEENPRHDRAATHAWILSFVRSPKPAKEESDESKGAKKWRKHADEQGVLCRAIRRRLEARPSLLKHLRGVSLMDWERNGPVWLFEPHLRRLVDASRRVAAEHPGLGVSPLRTALHLGEDFDHQLSGLRQIYEPFAWELIGRGDRIGHALALGLKPKQWAKRNPRVRVRPWDRILDVGFVAWAFADRGLPVDAEGINRLRSSAAECFAIVFEKCPGEALEAARHVWLELPVTRRPRGSRTTEMLSDWARKSIDAVQDDSETGRRGLSPSLIVDTGLDLPVTKAVHEFVHRQVAEMQVAIEINPSSNLLVGGFRSIFEQPVFHFADLPIVIGADDPLTFATTLADDYAYAWAGMVLSGEITPSQATSRLEEAARNSVRYAFHDYMQLEERASDRK